jgi:hypothetical protein
MECYFFCPLLSAIAVNLYWNTLTKQEDLGRTHVAFCPSIVDEGSKNYKLIFQDKRFPK